MSYRVSITYTGDHVEAWVVDLPGCISSRGLLPMAIAEHTTWLSRHGEDAPDRGDIEVVEEVHVADVSAPDGEFVFAADRAAVSADEVETAVRRLGYGRTDLQTAVSGLPDALLDWAPPISAMSSVHPWAPEVRTIRGIIRHIASTDAYYRYGLEDGDVSQTIAGEFGLHDERAQLVARMRALREADRTRVFAAKRAWRDRPEEWTLRKAIRRAISHERFHTKEIEQRLAWLLLGVPDFETSRARAERQGATVHG